MSVQEDYIKREIDRIGQVLSRIMAFILNVKSGSTISSSYEYTTNLLKTELDINFDLLLELNDKEFIEVLKNDHALSKCNLSELADILYNMIDVTEICSIRNIKIAQKCLAIYSYLEENDTLFSIERHQKIEELKNGTWHQFIDMYDAVLVGTFPIAINIEGSDLDILCCYNDKEVFIKDMEALFSYKEDFSIDRSRDDGCVVCRFMMEGYPVEIYASETPVKQQRGYLHMIIEERILQEKGESFRREIIELKKMGYKTEPAFCKLLGIEGDPYEGLIEYGYKENIL